MPLLVVAAAWLAQGPVLQNGWVWDDGPAVRDEENVRRGLAGVPALVTRNWYGDTDDVGLYRPVVGATLAIEAEVHGPDEAFGFHLTNLFLHGLVAVALLALLHRLLPDRPVVAAATAILFAVHPLHTGTVSWLVARADLLAALLSLAAALLWLRPGALRAGAVLGAALCVFLALGSKEMAAPLPGALLVLDLAARREGLGRTLARRGWAYLVLLVPLAAWFALRSAASGSFGTAPGMAALGDRDLGERLVVGLAGLARTAWNLAVPAGLSGDRSDDPLYEPGTPIPTAYVFVAVAILLALGIALYRAATGRGRVVPVAWTLFVLLSLPVVQAVPLGVLHEDRFAYLPSLALLAVGGVAVETLLSSRPRALAWGACGAVALALVAASWSTAADWRDDRRFNEALLERNPRHRPALNRLGRWHLDEGAAAIELAAQERVTGAPQPRRWVEEGNRHVAQAVRLLERATLLPSRRQSASIWRNLADARLRREEHAEAAQAYRTALSKKRVRLDGVSVPYQDVGDDDVQRVARPDARFMGETWHRLGLALTVADDREGALRALRQAALWLPDNGRFQFRAGAALVEAGRRREAHPFLDRAIDLLSGAEGAQARRTYDENVAQLRTLADQYFEKGLRDLRRADGQRDAIEAFEDAVAIQPNHVLAIVQLARLEAEWKGNYRAARDRLRQARAVIDEEASRPGAPDFSLERQEIEALEKKVETEAQRPETGE
jgi:tetratricopeptide (TPR) repeat protein